MDSTPNQDWVLISSSPLSAGPATGWATRANGGAVVSFCGTARTHSPVHDEVEALEYETNGECAERSIRRIIGAARTRGPDLDAVGVHHRIGRIVLTEIATVAGASAPHRHDAFETAQFYIDTRKKSVPMWKPELWRGGATWSSDTRAIREVPGP